MIFIKISAEHWGTWQDHKELEFGLTAGGYYLHKYFDKVLITEPTLINKLESEIRDASIIVINWNQSECFEDIRELTSAPILIRLTESPLRFQSVPLPGRVNRMQYLEKAEGVLVENDTDKIIASQFNSHVFKVTDFYPLVPERLVYNPDNSFTILHGYRMWNRGSNRDPYLWMNICEKLKIKNYIITPEFEPVRKQLKDYKYVEIKPLLTQREFQQSGVITKAHLVLLAGPSFTEGRIAGEAALRGIPCIGVKYGLMELLYPEYIFENYDIETGIEFIKEIKAGNFNSKAIKRRANMLYNQRVYAMYEEVFKAYGII